MNQQNQLMLRLARLKFPEGMDLEGDYLVFLFCKGGTGEYSSRSVTHRLRPGDILVFNASGGSKLSVFEHKAAEFLFWSFSVRFENLLPLFSGEEISLLHHITENFRVGRVYPATTAVAVDCQKLLEVVPPQFNLDHRGQLVRIAATILSVEFKDALAKWNGGSRANDHLVQVFEQLSASELISLSVCELASRFNCSRRHLNRLFHQHFGISVAALRMEMRLLKAISLLRDGEAKVINVAEQCGFNHLGLFNICFKRRFGTSPGQWRKLSLEKGAAENKVNGSLTCPMHYSGLCPLAGQPEASPPPVASGFASKIVNGLAG